MHDLTTRDRVFHDLYPELRRRAADLFRREGLRHTLQPTALVHEAYLRLVEQRPQWSGRGHLTALTIRLMRQILVDRARHHARQKRGGGAREVTLGEPMARMLPRSAEVLDLERALRRLAEHDPVKADLVELRVFGGLTLAEAASVLGRSIPTLVRDWRSARAWMGRFLQRRPDSTEG